jgi:hypothetical protein
VSVPEWLGDVPTWIGAGGAIGAAWFAYQTIKSQRQQIGEQQEFIAQQARFMAEQQQNLELERVELRAQAAERRISQARQIVMKPRVSGSSGIDEYGEEEGYDHWFVEVRNNSGDPIHDVLVRFGDTYNATSATDHEAPFPDHGGRPVPVPFIPPGGKIVFRSSRWSEATVDNNRPKLLFTDDSGVRWLLDSQGKLDEVQDDGTP